MSRHRLYLPTPVGTTREVALDGDRAHYVGRVLRAAPGTGITVFDGHGGEYAARVVDIGRNRVTLEILSHHDDDRESPLAVRLMQGVSRSGRMDIAIQKATELGVRSVQPVLTHHGVVRLKAEQRSRRQAHWHGIAVSACEQCGRNRVPQLLAPRELDTVLGELLGQPADNGHRLVLDPAADDTLDGPPPAGEVTLLIGPEGGLSEAELRLAAQAGFRGLRLGPRVLRTETAAIAALAVLQATWGDLRLPVLAH